MTEWLNTLHWQQPLWLALAAIPWLLLAWQRRQARDPRLARFADAHLLPRLLIGRPAAARGVLFAIAWTLAALAAAGPYWSRLTAPAETRGADIAVVVDISPSMSVADLAPTRLDRVKHELRDFVALLRGDRLGLVVFSGNAYPVLPLTTDRDAFLRFLDLLDPGLTQKPGSHLARAMEIATRLLDASPRGTRAVLLVSDGEFHDAEAASAAAQLRTLDIPLYTVGAATESGGPVPDARGRFLRDGEETVISQLDRARLTQLARDSGGRYVDLRKDDAEWREVVAALRARTHEATRVSAADHAEAVPLYPWLLAISLALFVWAGARRDALALLLLPMLIAAPSADAAPWTERNAYEALQARDYREAERLYSQVSGYAGALGAGTAAYRQRQWEAALAHFERALRGAENDEEKARALYNAGNALARLERFVDASARYQAALRLVPNFGKAALNLSLVNEFLDARRGLRERDDENLPAGSTTRSDARDSAAVGRGNDANLPSSAPPDQARNTQRQEQSARLRERSDPAARPTQTNAQVTPELQRTLSLWREANARGGPVELEGLRDDAAQFLRWRFREDDFGPQVRIVEDKPW